jgi:hypothetical protein
MSNTKSIDKLLSEYSNRVVSEEIQEDNTECPKATQDIGINLANRQICVDKANYGPANPKLDNLEFWQQKASLFKTSIEEAKTMRCSNCAAFIVKHKMMKCIEKGICEENMNEAAKIVNLANLGYCELFDFKCAGDRTCDAWITGGPLTDEV